MIRAAALVAAMLACAGVAQASEHASLPSPVAPLSPSPPLAGGANASAQNVSHGVTASTKVLVAIDDVGTPFAVTATQRLDVRGTGNYFFTVGAPVLTVRAAAGSDSIPGMRTGSILWAGFDPGRRLLAARITLDPAKAVSALPVRVRATRDAVVLENTTTVSVKTFSADAPRVPVAAYLAQLRFDVAHGRMPLQTTVPLSSHPVPARVTVRAPLHVVGTIGRSPVDLVLRHRARIRARGKINLRVLPVARVERVDAAGGRALLRTAILATLTLARAHQYEEFLGNPDPTGGNRTVYAYRTTSPPHAAPIASVGRHHWPWLTTGVVIAVLAAAAVGAAVIRAKRP